ncbi:hypothetical protein GUITHDRAFT_108687 [Guillardia theta CCMP2712]|uniref:Uncharacterized protein n=1 Tax=Guillardia theta (strain CCMP2712) TaxID=905079 RepID=L1JBF3_GUITC|nr:hypothetical protein GUITHDRAFT_108687 [Guillardia theta CCMP2712]EKX45420.1 hypothetical protein GUITHDRAFT_108687 [Guillardia theta CCMP2712]|eukprot:XP_005832400.1 hypothetical protein GUITHDRAFT_108687 [Guillardia theta CCMP2712]
MDHGQYVETVRHIIANALVVSRDAVDLFDEDGKTALHAACMNGWEVQVIELIRAGADVNKRCKYVGQSPLFFATKWEHANIMKILLDSGSDPEQEDKFGRSTLRWVTMQPNQDAKMDNTLQLLRRNSP